jgi:translation elongation factor EF-G
MQGKPIYANLQLVLQPLSTEELEANLEKFLKETSAQTPIPGHAPRPASGKHHHKTHEATTVDLNHPKHSKPIDEHESSRQVIAREHFLQRHPFIIEFGFTQDERLHRYYNEFKRREQKKRAIKKGKPQDDEEDEPKPAAKKEAVAEPTSSSKEIPLESLKFIRNPLELDEVETISDEFGEDALYALDSLPFEILHNIEKSIEIGLGRGPLLGYPVRNVKVIIKDGRYSATRSKSMAFEICAAQAIKEMLPMGLPILLEPMMDVEILAPNEIVKDLVTDLTGKRRGRVIELQDYDKKFGGTGEAPRSLINAVLPLSETLGYSTYIRSTSKVLFTGCLVALLALR